MLSFKSLAFVAAVAFGAFSTAFAAPATSSELVARDVRGVAAIIADLNVKIGPSVLQLNSVVKANATVEVITPIVMNLKGVIGDAVVEVINLADAAPTTILATVDGTAQVTVSILAGIIGDLLLLVFGALNIVLNVCDASVVSALIPVLTIVANSIGCLICAIFSLCGGLLVGLVGAVATIVVSIGPIITRLSVTVLVSLLVNV
ncbi:hypothetical protein EUX98_g8690 [Antrodiella citrinella]|uniref:Transmembrane protein n=1 Tax=Antrodiella citrinella TaxID=2447956 RepID=A0A4S4M420_9APHY|nr:hypothetical protein EUX98_g8690 [Antrodiella citrinella]